MSRVIIYKNGDGLIAIIHPSSEAIGRIGINAIAAKDVPFGQPYRIIDTSLIPPDRDFRGAWTVDDAELTDGVGANYGVGSINEVVGWDEAGDPVLKEVAQ